MQPLAYGMNIFAGCLPPAVREENNQTGQVGSTQPQQTLEMVTDTVKEQTVCVTGAGGYVASWLVNLLLSNHYIVHATVRRLGDDKYAHLTKLENAHNNLKLFEADLLDPDSLSRAIAGCGGVFHVASPVPPGRVSDPQVDLIRPAVDGTMNVLRACVEEARVKRVVVVSSGTAVSMNPAWPKGQIKDETCWSDKDYCKATNNWYRLAKTEAEMQAIEFARTTGLDVVTVCPTMVLGPFLQPTMNASTLYLIRLLNEGCETLENIDRMVVDARDVAEALLLVYEKPEAGGRYICTGQMIKARDLADKLKTVYPNYKYPKRFIDGEDGEMLSSEKLQRLGWRYRSLEETLVDSVECLQKVGILD